MSYPITVQYIPGLPNPPFRHGIGAYEGIAQHCTDNPNHSGGDTPTKERNYEVGSYQSAYVHFFIGVENNAPKIIQTAPTSYGAYGAGHTANTRFLHLELCMYDDPATFKMAYDAYVWLTAKLLADKNLGVSDKGTVWSHKEIADEWHETTHSDPIVYFQQHGISWTQHITNIQAAYNAIVAPPTPSKRFVKIVNVSAAAILMDKPDRINAKNIGTIPLNTVVELISPVAGYNNGDVGYYKVIYNGMTGYINAKFGVKI